MRKIKVFSQIVALTFCKEIIDNSHSIHINLANRSPKLLSGLGVGSLGDFPKLEELGVLHRNVLDRLSEASFLSQRVTINLAHVRARVRKGPPMSAKNTAAAPNFRR